MAHLRQLIHEIHRRSLWQVLAIYVGASWIVFDVVQTLTEGLGLPEWFPAFALVLLLIGLPLVLATAFVQQGLASGVRGDPTLIPEPAALSDREGAPERGGVRRLLTWRNVMAGGVLAFALWGVVAAGWILLGGSPTPRTAETGERASIAVLPFESLAVDPENEFFAAGIHEEVISQLSKIGGLKVISRTSVMEYAGRSENLRTIAAELGATNILEGSVRRSGDHVRITTQLIDARSDEHLWSESYDRQLTDIFAIQIDVAQRIADALNVRLTAREQERIERRPTDNVEAYDYYLRGRVYAARGLVREDAEMAVQMYERAVQLDTDFALAYAALSSARVWLGFEFNRQGQTEEAKAAVDRALELEPDLLEAHLALGDYHYYGHRDYEGALRAYEVVQRRDPNNALAIAQAAWIRRRQGNWAEAVAGVERALELDPRNQELAYGLAQTYSRMRRYREALRYVERGIAFSPQHVHGYQEKALIHLSWRGDEVRALEALREGAARTDDVLLFTRPLLYTGIFMRLFPEDLSHLLEEAPGQDLNSAVDSAEYYLVRAQAMGRLAGDTPTRALYDSARAVLERSIEAGNTGYFQHPGGAHSLLGLAYAGLGRHTEAVSEGQRAVGMLSPDRDALVGPWGIVYLSWIYAMLGEAEEAIDQLELLLSMPSPVSVELLELDPLWDSIREESGFRALLTAGDSVF